jgi:hypothetical protein
MDFHYVQGMSAKAIVHGKESEIDRYRRRGIHGGTRNWSRFLEYKDSIQRVRKAIIFSLKI